MFHAWCTGNDRVRRFGCREIKVPSSPLFFNTVYRHVVLVISYYCAPEFIIEGIFSLQDLTRFNKIATQGAPQMAVDKEANSLSRVYSYYSKFNLRLFYV